MNPFSPGTQTTTQKNTAPSYQRDLFKTAARDAMRFYKGGAGLNTGSMVVPYSKQSMGAFQDLSKMARGGAGDALSANMKDIIKGGGFNDPQTNVLQNWQSQINTPYAMNEDSKAVLDAALRDTQDAVNLNAASAGRYASGLHQGRLAQDIGDVSSRFRMQDYQNDLARKDALSSNLFNAAQAGMGNMSAAYQGMQAPQQTMLGVGAAQEDLKRRVLDDRSRIQNLPWEHVQRLLAAGGGMGSYGTTTTQAPGPNPLLTTLGGLGTVGNFLWGTQPMQQQGLLGVLG